MPLFRQPEVRPEEVRETPRRKPCKLEWDEEEEDEPSSLRHLCLLNLAENMKDVWTQDYAQNYMDQYFFRYIMGPFSLLRDVIEDLVSVLSQRNLLSRAALHLLLLPQLRSLALSPSSNLVTANLCHLIAARCQSLNSLDLSGTLNISSAALRGLLSGLCCLQSLSLAGTLCDHAVISTVAQWCPGLRHLDVSRCLHLSPGGLLSLRKCGSNRLGSLLALDIGLGEGEGDGSAVAAFLMLGVPSLRLLALEGVGEACMLIENKDFGLTEGFTHREGVPGLGKLWDERVSGDPEAEDVEEFDGSGIQEQADKWLSSDKCSIREENTEEFWKRKAEPGLEDKGKSCKLQLRELQGVTLTSLDAVSKLCPDLSSLALNCHDEQHDDDDISSTRGTLLTQGLSRWAGRLHSLSLQFPGLLSDLVPALQISGSCISSLTLEGVRVDGNLPFLAFVRACPKLATLVLHVDPPQSEQELDDDDDSDVEDWGLPCLPHLRTLTLNFSLDERQLKPLLCWTSLKGALWSLLRGARHLHTLCLSAAPCRLDPVFRLVLDRHAEPLRRLRRVSLKRSDVTMETTTRLLDACFYLTALDVSGCWSLSLSNINKLQSRARKRRHKLHITWT